MVRDEADRPRLSGVVRPKRRKWRRQRQLAVTLSTSAAAPLPHWVLWQRSLQYNSLRDPRQVV